MTPSIPFLPEGELLKTQENQELLLAPERWAQAAEEQTIAEGLALRCDANHDLLIDLGGGRVGRMVRGECAQGISTGQTKEIAILSRVGHPVCFCFVSPDGPEPLLSRRLAQKQALTWFLSSLTPGDILPARVTHLESFGAFVDIGCGVISLLGVETISVSRIRHPSARFHPGQRIRVVVTRVDPDQRRIFLSHRELLGTWEENATRFSPGETVPGVVRSIEPYGVFIELTPNLSGLAEHHGTLRVGQTVTVYIKSIVPEKMKIKLLIIDPAPPLTLPAAPLTYYVEQPHLERWVYTPACCTVKHIETHF